MASLEMKKDISSMSCREIFSCILTRQVYALMFHDQMANYFDFLGLNGFKRMHEYQYISESIGFRKLQRYYINRYNELVQPHEVSDPEAIPSEWMNHNRKDVTPQIKKRSVKEAFEEYREWEKETEDHLCMYANALCERGKLMDYSYVMGMVEDVCCELNRIDRMMLKLSGVDYSMEYIEEIQGELHEKYKKKTHRAGKKL